MVFDLITYTPVSVLPDFSLYLFSLFGSVQCLELLVIIGCFFPCVFSLDLFKEISWILLLCRVLYT